MKISSDTTINKKVITSGGKEVLRSKCRKIDSIYYLIGNPKVKDSGECYELLNTNTGKTTFYRASHPNLIWDYSKGEYCLKTNQIVGIISFNGSFFEKGYFTPDFYTNISYGNNIVMNESIMKKAGLVYFSFENCWLNEREIPKDRYRTGINEHFKKYPYNTFKEFYSTNEHSFFSQMQQIFNNWKDDNYKDSPFDKFFNNQTFGVEMETSAGNIPENLLYQYGLLPLKDGSIKGHEFTSVIIDDKYFNSFKNIFQAGQEYCTVNQNTSLHYHIGNINKSKEFVVAFWLLYYRLQESLEALCPPYKRDLGFLSNKRISSSGGNGVKDHCKRLPTLFASLTIEDVNKAFNTILTFVNDGYENPECIDSKKLLFKHSKSGRAKWDFESRYYALNLVPFLFESKQTVEFRFHSGTVNFYKGFAWALICSALLQYAELNIERILEGKEKIRLQDIIKVFDDKTPEGNFIVYWLLEYVNSRAEMHQTCILKHDIYGKEFLNDNQYKFTILNRQCPLTFKP